jgi:uncharacterized membrane protein
MNTLKRLIVARSVAVAVCIPFILFPWWYLFTVLNSHSPLFRSALVNYFIIIAVGATFGLWANRIRSLFAPHAKKIFTVLLGTAVFLYGCALFIITMYCYMHFIFESVDVSYYHISLWQLSQFKLPYIWDMPSIPIWQQHFEPILFFLVPIYWVIKNAGILVAVQALVVLSGAWPLYMDAANVLKSKYVALAISYAYLAFGGLQVGFAYGFHPIMFFPSLFIWAYYWYSRRNTGMYFVFVVLCLFVKEEISFIMMFWGLYVLLFKKEKLLGFGTITLGTLWYILCFHIIFPSFSPKEGFVYWGQYNQAYGTGVAGIITFALRNPRQFLTTLVTPNYKIETLVSIFGAFAFLPFVYPPSLLIVIPSLLEKLLSSGIAALNGTHYSAASAGVTVIASLEALRRARNNPRVQILRNNIFLGTFLFYVGFFSNVLYGCRTFALFPLGNIVSPPQENLKILHRIIKAIPDSATVGAQYVIAPHIQKPFGQLTPWPNYLNQPEYIIWDTKLPPILTEWKTVTDNLRTLSADPGYRLIVNQGGIIVFEKLHR